MMNRPRSIAGVLGVVVVASIGGVSVGSRIASPAEVAARTSPPKPSLILVPVEKRRLSADVVTRGTGRYGSPVKVSISASLLKQNPGRVGEVPASGTLLKEGNVMLRGLSRPLLFLRGAVAMTRDLGPGMHGVDVAQLEEGLQRIGFEPGPVDGQYDSLTGKAVNQWYAHVGFSPFTATNDQLASIRALNVALTTTHVDLLVASDLRSSTTANEAAAVAAVELAQTRSGAARATRVIVEKEAAKADEIAEAERSSRVATLDALRSPGLGRLPTFVELAAAEADIEAARAAQVSVRDAGVRATAEAQAALDQAPLRLQAAIEVALAANSASAAEIAARVAALAAASFPAVVVDGSPIDAARVQSQIAQANAELAASQRAAATTRITHDQLIADARFAIDRAPINLESEITRGSAANNAAAADVAAKQAALNRLSAPVVPTALDIANAERDLISATLSRDRVQISGDRAVHDASANLNEAASDVSAKRLALNSARVSESNAVRLFDARMLARNVAQGDVELARRQAGVQVPADELVFVPNEEVRISKMLVGSGDPISGSIMFVSDSLVYVDAAIPVESAGMVRAGMNVRIVEPDLSIDTVGAVGTLALTPGTNGVDGFHVYAEIAVAAPPANLVGSSVRLTLEVKTSDGEVLTVPISALKMGPDGSSRIERHRGAAVKFVVVTPGLSSQGFVAVAPVGNDVLRVGDLVAVGTEN